MPVMKQCPGADGERCTTLIPVTTKRCPRHARLDSAKRNRRTQRDGRNTVAWRRTRIAVLEAAGHQCQLQLDGCTIRATTVHRIGGGWHDDDSTGYIAACHRCHGAQHPGGSSSIARTPSPTPPQPLRLRNSLK